MANWVNEHFLNYPEQKKRLIRRSQNALHIDNGNGTITAYILSKPIHYLENGNWKEIDTAWIDKGNGRYGAAHSKIIAKTDGTIGIDGTGYVQRTELPELPTTTINDDKIIREFSWGKQTLYMLPDGFRQEIVLYRKPNNLAEVQTLVAEENGVIDSKFIKNKLRAVDASGFNYYEFDGLQTFRRWLDSAQYPVLIDPDISVTTGDGSVWGYDVTYSTARSTLSGAQYSDTTNLVGQNYEGSTTYHITRCLLKFDTSSLPDDATISDAVMRLVISTDGSFDDFDLDIVKADWSSYDPIGTNDEAAYDLVLSATKDVTFINTSGISTNVAYESPSLDTSWINTDAATYYGLRSSKDYAGVAPTGGEFVYIYSGDHGTPAYRPVLKITYEYPAVVSVTTTGSGGGTTSFVIDLPATIDEGDLLIAIVASDGNVTIGTPTNWSQLSHNSDGNVTLAVFGKDADGTEDGGTITCSISSSEDACAQVYRIINWNGVLTDDVDVGSVNTGTDSYPNPPSVTAGWGSDKNLFIAMYAQDGNRNVSGYPTNYSNDQTYVYSRDFFNFGTVCIASATREYESLSDNPGTFMAGGSDDWVAQTLVVRPLTAEEGVDVSFYYYRAQQQ